MSEAKLMMTSAEFVRGAADTSLRDEWGGWWLDGFELAYPAYYPGGGVYPIDVRRFTQSSEVLDVIMQVARKDWASGECVAGLVRALDHILDPQAYL